MTITRVSAKSDASNTYLPVDAGTGADKIVYVWGSYTGVGKIPLKKLDDEGRPCEKTHAQICEEIREKFPEGDYMYTVLDGRRKFGKESILVMRLLENKVE